MERFFFFSLSLFFSKNANEKIERKKKRNEPSPPFFCLPWEETSARCTLSSGGRWTVVKVFFLFCVALIRVMREESGEREQE